MGSSLVSGATAFDVSGSTSSLSSDSSSFVEVGFVELVPCVEVLELVPPLAGLVDVVVVVALDVSSSVVVSSGVDDFSLPHAAATKPTTNQTACRDCKNIPTILLRKARARRGAPQALT